MKNVRAIWMLVFSALLGLLVVFMVAGRLAPQTVAANKVVVAAVDIEMGSKLNPQMLSVIDWPPGNVPAGAFANLNDLQDRVVKASVQRGEAILSTKLAPMGSAGGLSSVIADGKRAMTVRVNDVVGVAGFALPGNYVDVLVNTNQEAGKGTPATAITKTVLEHVLVLAVAQEANRDETKPRVVNAVTLELSPAEAEKIDLARNVGTLSLVLRNQIDRSSVATTGITKSQLFAEDTAQKPALPTMQPKKATARARPATAVSSAKKDCVEVIQDGARSLSCF